MTVTLLQAKRAAKLWTARDLKRHVLAECHGFLTVIELDILARSDRLCPVLVRTGKARFTCPAQDAEHLIGCIQAGGDYVRDLSLPIGTSTDSHGGA